MRFPYSLRVCKNFRMWSDLWKGMLRSFINDVFASRKNYKSVLLWLRKIDYSHSAACTTRRKVILRPYPESRCSRGGFPENFGERPSRKSQLDLCLRLSKTYCIFGEATVKQTYSLHDVR